MLRILIYFISIIALIALCSVYSTRDDLILELLLILLASFSGYWFKILPNLKLHLRTTLSLNRNKDLRVTFAYLIKIKAKDDFDESKYLLVKNNHFEAYQPPGGVYKFQDKFYLEGTGVKEDTNFHKEGDLRLITKRKHFPDLLEKFNSKQGREVSIEREFHEELIATNIFDRKDFPYLNYSFIRTDLSQIGFSTHFNCDELKVFDIFEVHLNEKQKQVVSSLIEKESHKYIFVNEEEISKELYRKSKGVSEKRITDTSTLILKPSI